MRPIILARAGLALTLAANGIAMLAVPERWYLAVPGVLLTGPLNLHFVRDIGCAYLVAGLAFAWLARQASAWPAALAGGLFLALHAGVHLVETACGVSAPSGLLRDLPGVFLLPVIALWLARKARVSLIDKENSNARMDHAPPRAAPARHL